MYTNPLLELNASWIPVLEWSVVQDEEEAQSLRHGWGISVEWTILATDFLGDIIVLKSDVLYSINHEDLEATRLAPSLIELLGPLADLCKVGEYSDDTPLPELRAKKTLLTELKKSFKGSLLQDNIEDEIEELKEFISDWKFYQTDRGKVWLEMNRFSKEYGKAIGKPAKYTKVNLTTDAARLEVVVSGYMVGNDESVSELKSIAETLPHSFLIHYENLHANQEEHMEFVRNQQREYEARLQQRNSDASSKN